MKRLSLTTAIAVFCIIISNGIQAQTTKTQLSAFYLGDTEQFSVKSKYVEGETYIIQVGLPFGYSSSKKCYPVLYVTDGETIFGMTKVIADLLAFCKEIKDIIIVGIGYGQKIDVIMKKRIRDLRPIPDTLISKGQNVGGADDFLKFIQYELFPVINKNYRTNPDSIALKGMSLGGLFNSYILFTQPDLFKAYIIDEPTSTWKNNSILHLETEYFNNHKELNATVYLAYGSLDTNISQDNIVKLIKLIQMHNYNGLKLFTRVFEGETHCSLHSTAAASGLKTIFKP